MNKNNDQRIEKALIGGIFVYIVAAVGVSKFLNKKIEDDFKRSIINQISTAVLNIGIYTYYYKVCKM